MMQAGLAARWLVLLAAACAAFPAVARAGVPFRVVPEHARIGPGEYLQMAVEPDLGRVPEPPVWLLRGRGGVSLGGRYRAPYVVSPRGEVVRIVAFGGSKDSPDSAEATVKLEPGTMAGAQDCLGQGQTWAPEGGLPYVPVDELAAVITTVEPQYPKSLRFRDIHTGFVVNAIVCSSGRVFDASVQWGLGVIPVPELEAPAIEAVQQWRFTPARVAGQPVACHIAIPMVYPPPPTLPVPSVLSAPPAR